MNDPRIDIKQIPELAQRQDSTFAQLQDAKVICTKLGMYDAADAIQRHLDRKSDFIELEDRLKTLTEACFHYLGMATPLQGVEARAELMKVVQAVGQPIKKTPHLAKLEAINNREILVELKFDEFWKARSELFRKQFGSSSIARDLWEHAVEICQDIPKV